MMVFDGLSNHPLLGSSNGQIVRTSPGLSLNRCLHIIQGRSTLASFQVRTLLQKRPASSATLGPTFSARLGIGSAGCFFGDAMFAIYPYYGNTKH